MIAARTDLDDAVDLCEIDDMAGKVCVAAHNSPTSVTLSGDVDAVGLAERVFEDEHKFGYVLKVDTAYLKALHAAGVQVQPCARGRHGDDQDVLFARTRIEPRNQPITPSTRHGLTGRPRWGQRRCRRRRRRPCKLW